MLPGGMPSCFFPMLLGGRRADIRPPPLLGQNQSARNSPAFGGVRTLTTASLAAEGVLRNLAGCQEPAVAAE